MSNKATVVVGERIISFDLGYAMMTRRSMMMVKSLQESAWVRSFFNLVHICSHDLCLDLVSCDGPTSGQIRRNVYFSIKSPCLSPLV
jgi:hypothetical protein